jgi:hypothetical protein
LVLFIGLKLQATRKHMNSLEIALTMITRDTSFLVDIILVEITLWSWSKT